MFARDVETVWGTLGTVVQQDQQEEYGADHVPIVKHGAFAAWVTVVGNKVGPARDAPHRATVVQCTFAARLAYGVCLEVHRTHFHRFAS